MCIYTCLCVYTFREREESKIALMVPSERTIGGRRRKEDVSEKY
jgi:hypothetical protein